jgi:hypothetical protein
VRVKGLEPPQLASQEPKPCVSTSSTTPARALAPPIVPDPQHKVYASPFQGILQTGVDRNNPVESADIKNLPDLVAHLAHTE